MIDKTGLEIKAIHKQIRWLWWVIIFVFFYTVLYSELTKDIPHQCKYLVDQAYQSLDEKINSHELLSAELIKKNKEDTDLLLSGIMPSCLIGQKSR